MRLLAGIAVVVCAAHTAAQSPTTPTPARRLAFEVASIKQNKSGDQRTTLDALPSGRVGAVNAPLIELIRNAFQLQRHELVEGERMPAWISTDRWDITAQAPAQTTPDQWRVMLQNLLVDRYALVLRKETRTIPAFALVVARSDRRLGPQLKPSSADCDALTAAALAAGGVQGRMPVCGMTVGPNFINGRGVQMSRLVRTLSPVAGRYVVDATALTDRFDVELKWTASQELDAGNALNDGASLFSAVQEQLGLRLEPRQTAADVLVIESAERPKEE